MIAIITIIVLLLLIVITALITPIELKWQKDKGGKSMWKIFFLLGSISSDGGRILWFKVKPKTKKHIGNYDEKKFIQRESTEKIRYRRERSKRGKKFGIDDMRLLYQKRRLLIKTLSAMAKFLLRIVRSFKIRKSNLMLSLSLDDPFALGTACAIAYPLLTIVPQKLNFRFIPNFEEMTNKIEIFGQFFAITRVYRLMIEIFILICVLPKIELYRFYKAMKRSQKTRR